MTRPVAVLWLLVILALGCLVAFVALVNEARAHDWYDRECCSNQDCYPLPGNAYLEERANGEYYAKWISPLNGQLIEGIVRKCGVRDTRDGRIHGCENFYHTPRCIYIHPGA